MSIKESALTFLNMVVDGDIDEAYHQFIATDFIHHNMYFKGDRQSLLDAMKESDRQVPEKIFEVNHVYETKDSVITHSLMKPHPKHPGYAVVHIMKFKNEKIIEMWDLGQEIDPKSPNENGMF